MEDEDEYAQQFALGHNEVATNPHTTAVKTTPHNEQRNAFHVRATASKEVAADERDDDPLPSPSTSIDYQPPSPDANKKKQEPDYDDAAALKDVEKGLLELDSVKIELDASSTHPASVLLLASVSSTDASSTVPTNDQRREDQHLIQSINAVDHLKRELAASMANVEQIKAPLRTAHDTWETTKAGCETRAFDIQTKIKAAESTTTSLKKQLKHAEKQNLGDLENEIRTFRELNASLEDVVAVETDKAVHARDQVAKLQENIMQHQENRMKQAKRATQARFSAFAAHSDLLKTAAESEHLKWVAGRNKQPSVSPETTVLVEAVQQMASQLKETRQTTAKIAKLSLQQELAQMEAKKASLLRLRKEIKRKTKKAGQKTQNF
jgi:hypothetical protein